MTTCLSIDVLYPISFNYTSTAFQYFEALPSQETGTSRLHGSARACNSVPNRFW